MDISYKTKCPKLSKAGIMGTKLCDNILINLLFCKYLPKCVKIMVKETS